MKRMLKGPPEADAPPVVPRPPGEADDSAAARALPRAPSAMAPRPAACRNCRRVVPRPSEFLALMLRPPPGPSWKRSYGRRRRRCQRELARGTALRWRAGQLGLEPVEVLLVRGDGDAPDGLALRSGVEALPPGETSTGAFRRERHGERVA